MAATNTTFGIPRIDGDLPDVLGVVEAEVRPDLAGVGRLVDAVPESDRIAQGGLAAADVDRIGRRRRNGERADGGDGLRVEDRASRCVRRRSTSTRRRSRAPK